MSEIDPENPFASELEAHQYEENIDPIYGTVEMDGRLFPVVGGIEEQNLALWEPRFIIGEPKVDDDKYFSIWAQTNWTGGGQIEVLNPSSDIQRFYFGTADGQHPDMLTLPLETLSYTVATPAGNAIPIGDYKPDATILFWGSFGVELHYWDATLLAWTAADTLSAEPYGAMKGVVYDDLLFIPLGTSGYDTWDGTTVVNSTTVTPVAFVEWDDKLISLGIDGQIGVWNGVNWSLPSEMKLRGNRIPRNLVVWWTPERKAAVYIVTNRDVYVCDFLTEVVIRTGLRFPVHPDFGLGSAAWQDDAMYVSVGLGVHQFAMGGVVSGMGPDRDSGLPSYLRGAIVDMEPEYNGMFALIKGIGTTTIGDDAETGITIEESMLFDGSMIVPTASSQARSTLMRWDGSGWHTLWVSAGATGEPTKVMISEADGDYRVWWGYGESFYTQPLRRTFYNPKQGAALGIDRFELSASLQTGKFDAGMKMFHKLASHCEAKLANESDGTVDIYYRSDHEPAWVFLGRITEPGMNVIEFDPDGDGWSEGLHFHWIEFDYQLASTDPYKTPILEWISLNFIKIPIQTKAWNFTVPFTFPEQMFNRDPLEMRQHLNALASGETFFTFTHQGETFRVRMARTSGMDMPARNPFGSRQVNLVELPTGAG